MKMTKYDIIKECAEKRIVEDIIFNIIGYIDFDLQDLIQDIYVDLLEKEEEKIVKLYEDKKLKFFIIKVVTNNLWSVTSRYFIQYKLHLKNKETLEKILLKEDED